MSWMPCRISCPRLRVFSHLASCLSVILPIFEGLLHAFEHVRRDILLHTLAVEGDHPDLIVRAVQVVDHTQPATFAATPNAPSQFAYTPRAAHNVSSLGMLSQKPL